MARYKVSRGSIYDTVTGRWEGEYSPERLAELEGTSAVAEEEGGLESLTVKDLQKLAADLEVEGRSAMNKDELVATIQTAQAEEGGSEEE